MKSILPGKMLRSVVPGVIAMLALSLLLSAASAYLAGRGILPVSAMRGAACTITVIAALCGAILCGLRAGSARLPLCLVTGAVYLLLVFVIRGLIFRTTGDDLWIIPVCVLAASIAGAVITSAKKHR